MIIKWLLTADFANCAAPAGRSKHFLDQTGLHLATYFGHTRVVELLLEHGADINAVNQCGDTPLHKAAHIGHEVGDFTDGTPS